MGSPLLPLVRAALALALLAFSAAILYTTAVNARAVSSLAEGTLESTGLALATSAEDALRAGGAGRDGEVREILSDRVVAYALIAAKDGTVLFHTSPWLAGTRLEEEGLADWLRSGKTFGRRITLGTGLPAYEFNYILRTPAGEAEILRLVLHTSRADRVLSDARRMWWVVGAVLLLVWCLGIGLERLFTRHLRLQAAAERRERLSLIGQMTATLVHEIRNALGSIKGYTQWVDEKVEESHPGKRGLAVVLRGAERIESLVQDLLLFSREESYSIEPVDPGPVLRETARQALAGWEGELELAVDDRTRLMADVEKLRRVLLNGFRNALQAMGERGTLTVSTRPEKEWVAIRIEDAGPGIPAPELPRLFTPFYTTKADGTGLGLAYSKKVIEGMRGVITLSNREDGNGAVLVIRLPRAGERDLVEVHPDRGR